MDSRHLLLNEPMRIEKWIPMRPVSLLRQFRRLDNDQPEANRGMGSRQLFSDHQNLIVENAVRNSDVLLMIQQPDSVI